MSWRNLINLVFQQNDVNLSSIKNKILTVADLLQYLLCFNFEHAVDRLSQTLFENHFYAFLLIYVAFIIEFIYQLSVHEYLLIRMTSWEIIICPQTLMHLLCRLLCSLVSIEIMSRFLSKKFPSFDTKTNGRQKFSFAICQKFFHLLLSDFSVSFIDICHIWGNQNLSSSPKDKTDKSHWKLGK